MKASKVPKLSLLLIFCFFNSVLSKNEVLPTWVSVATPRAACIQNAQSRPCPITRAAALLTADDLPDGLQCPCPISNPGDGSGGIIGANGPTVKSNPDKDFFVDEILVNGFDNPVGMSFTDNSNELFVGTRQGLIWYVNLNTMQKKIFIDINGEVGLSGDRGLMDVVAHPNYANVKQMLVQFTVDPTPGDGVEPDAEGAANQRLIRLQDLGDGVVNPNFRLTLFGAGEGDGVPICFNTHALGSLNFGLDGSLLVTTGEGAHWNFDMGDWGQDALLRFDAQGQPIPSLDNECLARFGAEQDIGAFRSLVHYSLDGKVLRIAPDSGDGICNGSATGSGYPIKNPFCDITPGTSVQSKIWAIGLRNPFRSTVRPLLPGEAYVGGPGVLYFGDVGQGGYEEINAVVQGGMNFGWPCWEGPMPSPIYRDSLYNRDLTTVFNAGCGGTPTIPGTCGNITTFARNPDGTIMTCRYIYKNVTTSLPFFYWSRFPQNDNAGYFSEVAYTGQGLLGATTAGLAFYTGDKYPTKYKNALFALEFSNNWIKVIFTDGSDKYVSIQDFADLIYTIPTNGAKVTLKAGPDGNICYITMNGGEVRCFRYIATNIAPSFSPGATENTGNAPVDIHFHMDGSFDRENDMVYYEWNFGDGQTSREPNPVHTYSTGGSFNVTLSGVDKYGHSSNGTMTVITNNRRPKVRITSPVTNLPNRVYVYQSNETVYFNATVNDENEATCSYRWEIQFVHNNHIHTDVANIYTRTFSYAGSAIPTEGALERNNVKLILHVTDAQGLSATDVIFLSRSDWFSAFGGNSAPVPSFTTNTGFLPLEVGQPVRFDAQATNDENGDRIDYYWSFGDGYNSSTVTTTHSYSNPGVYTVRLEVFDNWGAYAFLEQQITVRARTSIQPYSTVLSGQIYQSFYTQLGSVQPGAEIRYSLDGTDPTQCSSLYNGPSLFIAFYPNVNVTLKIRSFVDGYGPSDAVSYSFQMIEPPCYEMGLGYVDGNNLGELFCINTVASRPNGSVVDVPFANPLTALYTTAPPATGYVDYYIRNLNGIVDSTRNEFTNTTNIWFWADQGSSVGAVLKVGVSYDFTGDGTFDRFEVFENIPPDPVPNEYEEFTFATVQTRFPLPSSIQGTGYQTLVNGTVRVQIWEGIHNNNNGTTHLRVRVGDSVVQNQKTQMSRVNIPYKSFVFQNFGANPYVGGPTPTTGNCNAVFTTGSVTSGAITTGITTGSPAGVTTSSASSDSGSATTGGAPSVTTGASPVSTSSSTSGDNVSVSSAYLLSVNLILLFLVLFS